VLHRAGLYTVMNAVTGSSANKFAQGFKWGFRDFGLSTLTYPFWTVEPATGRSVEQYATVGEGGLNRQLIVSRIYIFDKYSNTQVNEDTFVALVDVALTELRKDANINLGQQGSCIINRILSYQLSYDVKSSPPLRIAMIDCQGEYLVNRT
jgi:hypothetical protein